MKRPKIYHFSPFFSIARGVPPLARGKEKSAIRAANSQSGQTKYW
jgi:hypothetical protein